MRSSEQKANAFKANSALFIIGSGCSLRRHEHDAATYWYRVRIRIAANEQSLVFIALESEDWGADPKGQNASTPPSSGSNSHFQSGTPFAPSLTVFES